MKNVKRVFIIFFGLVLITIAAIYIVYGAEFFRKWSWLQSAITISLFTCMGPYLVRQAWGRIVEERGACSCVWAVFWVPFVVLLTHPGLDRLGLRSDGKGYWLAFCLMIVHGIGFYIIFRGIKNVPE